MSAENVNHPSHYTQGGIECIEAIRASMPPEGFQDYCKGNVLKYIWRWRDKGGAEDLEKAKVYLQWAIDSAEGKSNDDKPVMTLSEALLYTGQLLSNDYLSMPYDAEDKDTKKRKTAIVDAIAALEDLRGMLNENS